MTEKVRTAGSTTISEILQQPELWLTTLQRVQAAAPADARLPVPSGKTIVTGAGTSAYAAAAIAASLAGARAIPTTDLLSISREELENLLPQFAEGGGLVISVARSGNSPESVAVVERLSRLYPATRHLAITCNAEGRLANLPGVAKLVLDPRTNDQSLVMTSSFSNLTLAGMTLQRLPELSQAAAHIGERASQLFPSLQKIAAELAASDVTRVVVLASGPLFALASEASLKILEMTAGRTLAIPETPLGLRHGPMSFLRQDTLVLCVASSSPERRRYEADLLHELRGKSLGRIVAVAPEDFASGAVDVYVPPLAPGLPDLLRTPFEIPFAQILGYSLSLQAGLDPDNPSPEGVITRVVQSFRVYANEQEQAGV